VNINNPTTFSAPDLTLSTSNSSGSAGALRADDTILVYDNTAVDAITFGQAGSVGSASTASRRDHAHAMAALAVPLTAIDIDGGTDIGGAIVDADLFIVDDGAGGTNRKSAASRIKTYTAGSNISAKVTHDADQSTTSGAEMTVAFNTTTFDSDDMADVANRLTFTQAGTYLVQAYVQIEGNTSGRRHLALRLNGAGNRLAVVQSAPSLADQWGNIVSLLLVASATDYIEVRFLQTSGGALNIQANNGSPWLSAVKILG